MTHPLFVSSLALSAVLLGSGCGGSGTASTATESLDFTTDGTYDLSHYLVPEHDQLSTFIERTYTDNTGNHIYGSMPTTTSETTQRYEVGNTEVKEYDDKGQLDTTYTISQTAITQTLNDAGSLQIDDVIKTVRYADLGDPVVNAVLDIPFANFGDDVATTVTCRLQDHVDSKTIATKTYQDVIAVSCEGVANTEMTYDNTPVLLDISMTGVWYYAKNTGEIGSVTEVCYTLNGTQTVQACTKTVSEIASVL